MRKECRKTVAVLPTYLAEEATAGERRLVEEHLRVCRECGRLKDELIFTEKTARAAALPLSEELERRLQEILETKLPGEVALELSRHRGAAAGMRVYGTAGKFSRFVIRSSTVAVAAAVLAALGVAWIFVAGRPGEQTETASRNGEGTRSDEVAVAVFPSSGAAVREENRDARPPEESISRNSERLEDTGGRREGRASAKDRRGRDRVGVAGRSRRKELQPTGVNAGATREVGIPLLKTGTAKSREKTSDGPASSSGRTYLPDRSRSSMAAPDRRAARLADSALGKEKTEVVRRAVREGPVSSRTGVRFSGRTLPSSFSTGRFERRKNEEKATNTGGAKETAAAEENTGKTPLEEKSGGKGEVPPGKLPGEEGELSQQEQGGGGGQDGSEATGGEESGALRTGRRPAGGGGEETGTRPPSAPTRPAAETGVLVAAVRDGLLRRRQGKGAARRLRVGDDVRAGMELFTDAGGRAELLLPGDGRLFLRGNTRLTLTCKRRRVEVFLMLGEVDFIPGLKKSRRLVLTVGRDKKALGVRGAAGVDVRWDGGTLTAFIWKGTATVGGKGRTTAAGKNELATAGRDAAVPERRPYAAGAEPRPNLWRADFFAAGTEDDAGGVLHGTGKRKRSARRSPRPRAVRVRTRR